VAAIARGGYVLRDCAGTPDAIIIATGSEVDLAVKAAEALSDKAIRVVSMPSTSAFDAQDAAYKESVLPKAVTARVAVEAAVTAGWWKYVGSQGAVVGIDRFGESAPPAHCSRSSASPSTTWLPLSRASCSADQGTGQVGHAVPPGWPDCPLVTGPIRLSFSTHRSIPK
jgi:hypothetical protein